MNAMIRSFPFLQVYEPVEEGSYIKMIDMVSGHGGQIQVIIQFLFRRIWLAISLMGNVIKVTSMQSSYHEQKWMNHFYFNKMILEFLFSLYNF